MSQDEGKLTKEPTEYTVEQKAQEEGWKLYYDSYKHLTTLCTGSILILITFLEKIFANPKWKALVGAAFGFFVLSIIASVIEMVSIASAVTKMGPATEDRDFEEKMDLYIAISAFTCFLSGIICLIIFAMKNLYG
ncbi:MAG TPA: hypothetical protein VE732_04575 [Nitrososphaera sp.]|jgi:hypothetical protein|nr:hypothetical protein [Nitrososphaera sp.]